MDSLFTTDLNIVQAFQGLGPWLRTPATLMSFLGREEFYLLIMPLLLWCLNAPLGFRVGIALLTSTSIVTALKLVLHVPRPYWVSTAVQPMSVEPSFALPSGHAQNAASVWGRLAVGAQLGWLRWVVLLIIVLIGLSRVYLGVHFLSDVVLGWLVGGLLLWGLLRLERPVGTWLGRQTFAIQVGMALLASLALLGLNLGALASVQTLAIPPTWEQLASRAPNPEFDPFNIDDAISACGTLLGLAAGWAWTLRRGGFTTNGSLAQRVGRYAIGLLVVLALWQGLGAVFPRDASVLAALLRYVRYALIGLWVAGLAPLVFTRLGLTVAPERRTPPPPLRQRRTR